MKISPSLDEAKQIAKTGQYNVMPLSCEILSDICTPLEALRALKNVSTHCYMLESVAAKEKWGRYTFLGFDPKLEITCTDGEMKAGNIKLKTDDPSAFLRQILADYKIPRFDYLPSFTGGLVGYFSYDYLGYSDPTARSKAQDSEAFKDVDLMLFDKVIAFDRVRQKIILIANMSLDDPEVAYNKAVMELTQMRDLLRHGERRDEPGGHMTGNVAKPLRLALGACIIQAEYGFSDEETALMIQENPYLQYFCGYPGYDDEKLPFDPSLMVYFRKRLTPEVLGEINEMIVRDAKERQAKEAESKDDGDDSDNHPGAGGNSGTMIVDATCAPSNIRYPQDVSLLNEARENAEKLLDALHDPADGKKPRTYRQRARKDYLKYTRCRKHTAKMTRKAIGKQLTYLRRDLDAIDGKLSLGKSLTTRQMERLDTIHTIYEQQKYMYDNHHSVPDRIVSVSQPFVRPIVRGKAGKPVEFGTKLDISVVDGWTRLECCSFDAYNEAGNLQEMAERFRKREGHYPSRILADRIYRNRENLNYCKAHGIRLSGPALGRPRKGEPRDKAQDYRDECERVEVERRFSLAKRKCGMGLVTAKLRETAAHVIAMSVLVLNLRKIQCSLLRLLTYLLAIFPPKEKWAIVQ